MGLNLKIGKIHLDINKVLCDLSKYGFLKRNESDVF